MGVSDTELPWPWWSDPQESPWEQPKWRDPRPRPPDVAPAEWYYAAVLEDVAQWREQHEWWFGVWWLLHRAAHRRGLPALGDLPESWPERQGLRNAAAAFCYHTVRLECSGAMVLGRVLRALELGTSDERLRDLLADADLAVDEVATKARIRRRPAPDQDERVLDMLGDAERKILGVLIKNEKLTTDALLNRGATKRAISRMDSLGLLDRCGAGTTKRGLYRLSDEGRRIALRCRE